MGKKILLAWIILNLTTPFVAAEELRDASCACVGSKKPAEKDYAVIRGIFPNQGEILRMVFKSRTYYLVVKNHKIHRILSGWETPGNTENYWAVFDLSGKILEYVVYPGNSRVLLEEQRIYISRPDSGMEDSLPEGLLPALRGDLAPAWKEFTRRSRMAVYQADAVTQATP